MALLTDYLTYADAQVHCTSDALWALFDGNRERMNIAPDVSRSSSPVRTGARSVSSMQRSPVIQRALPTCCRRVVWRPETG
jgi:hypothetical protein